VRWSKRDLAGGQRSFLLSGPRHPLPGSLETKPSACSSQRATPEGKKELVAHRRLCRERPSWRGVCCSTYVAGWPLRRARGRDVRFGFWQAIE